MFALLVWRRRPPLVGRESCCFESLTSSLISECPNRPITSSCEVRCHIVTGRCLVFRKHLQYPAFSNVVGVSHHHGVPQWAPARPTWVICVWKKSSRSRDVVIDGCVYMPQQAAWDIHADPRHMGSIW